MLHGVQQGVSEVVNDTLLGSALQATVKKCHCNTKPITFVHASHLLDCCQIEDQHMKTWKQYMNFTVGFSVSSRNYIFSIHLVYKKPVFMLQGMTTAMHPSSWLLHTCIQTLVQQSSNIFDVAI